MEETDVALQIYSFLDVMVVRYDEKTDKDGQRCDIRDIVIRRKVLCLTTRLNQPAGSIIDCTIHVPKLICRTFSLQTVRLRLSVLRDLKHIFKTYL